MGGWDDIAFPRVFLTGIYGSGKTTTARSISVELGLPYKSFDANWDYRRQDIPHARTKLAQLGDRFVVDGIAYNCLPDRYVAFSEYYDEHHEDTLIIFATCLNLDEWKMRIRRKRYAPALRQALDEFREFYTVKIHLHDGKRVRYFDTSSSRYVTKADINTYMETIV